MRIFSSVSLVCKLSVQSATDPMLGKSDVEVSAITVSSFKLDSDVTHSLSRCGNSATSIPPSVVLTAEIVKSAAHLDGVEDLEFWIHLTLVDTGNTHRSPVNLVEPNLIFFYRDLKVCK